MVFFLSLFLTTWQQRVAYKINARLDVDGHTLKAVEYMTYHNNSPCTLETLYMHLYANAYKHKNTVYAQEAEKIGEHDFRKLKESETGYIDIEEITRGGDQRSFEIDETIMAVSLEEPLRSNDSVALKIYFTLKIPKQVSRLGYQGDHYEIVQWYPKPCVFDEDGWHRDNYHALGEFYGEYGSFDVEIDLPGDYVVAATGERIEPSDKAFIDSLIISGKKINMGDRKTVRFYAEDVHDFAWVCDPDFLVEKRVVDSIDIFIFYLKGYENGWKNAGHYAIDAVSRFNRWFGKYPYQNLSVVHGYFQGGAEYPNLVIIGIAEDWITRLFEIMLIHEIAHQWFYGVLGSNEMDEAWLDEGFTTYTEIRYLENKYGENNSFFKLSFLPIFSRRYYHKLYYYITNTNEIERPILTPAYDFIDMPFAYANSAYSKPALFLVNLEGILGEEKFQRILKQYFEHYKLKHPKTADFIKLCSENSPYELEKMFDQILASTGFSDWRVKRVEKNVVLIENVGDIIMPVDVLIEGTDGHKTVRCDGKKKLVTIVLPELGSVKKVVIDPQGYSLETNHWNNYYPRKIKIKPIIDLPSFDAYQIFYLPYLWYGSYDGIIAGAYFLGTEFADFDFVKGRHQWTAGCVYGMRSGKFYPVFSYQTPIIFKKNMRTRILLAGSNSNDEDKFDIGLLTNVGLPFSRGPKIEAKNVISYYRLNSFHLIDSIDWELGRNVVFENCFDFKYQKWEIGLGLTLANTLIGGEWNYLKTTLEIKREIEGFIPFSVRFFAGKIFGAAPIQEKIFLSGKLRISLLANLLFNQKGYFSPQEHLHIKGDGNMLGYHALHMKSDELYCLNFEFPSRSPIRFFTDFGYYGEYAFDLGARLVFGPVSLNFPFYTRTDKPWAFRWSIGL